LDGNAYKKRVKQNYTQLALIIIFRENQVHIHENIDSNIIIVRQTISNGIKRKGLNYITDRPSKLIEFEIANR